MSQAAKDPFFEAERYKLAARAIIGEDGVKRVEKRPIQKSARMIHPSGDVVWVPLYAGPSQLAENDPYKMATVFAKQRLGFLFLNRCPQMEGYETQRHLPASLRGRKPCEAGAKGGPISDADPCKCALEVSAIRRGIQSAAMEKINNNEATRAARDAAATQVEMLAETKKQNALLVDLATKNADKPQRNKGNGE